MASGLLEQSAVYLGAAVIVVPLVKRLKLSSVLGYLIAGIIIGPFVLGLVGQSDSEREKVMHFAEFGVVIMLFLIGLELRPALLWRLRGSILGMGGAQVLLTTLVLAAIALLLGQPLPSAVAIGMILALSSTAIVLQILNEKSLMKTPAGKNVFSVLLFQDIAVIPMLALLPLLAVDAVTDAAASHSLIADWPAWLQVLAVLLTIGVIILLGRFALNHVFHLVADTHIHELFTALTLFIVIGIAVLMQQLGLSPALGTFIAGVVLAESQYRHQLELDLAPFKGLLLGLFFMAVGAGIDFQLLGSSLFTVIGLVIGLMLVKFALLLLVARLFKMNITKKMLFAFYLAQAGEFAFVLFAMAVNLNVLAMHTVDLLILVVALSMMLTPVMMILLDKVILPRLLSQSEPESDTIEDDSNAVIIAGYGRFGQMVGRLLNANGIASTVLDFNSDHVDTIRRFGQKVYYGDASRLDLLEAAGIKDAKVLIVAIADRDKSIHLVQQVKQAHPHIRIFVRAIGREHAYELMTHDVIFERETLLSALHLGEQVLTTMGYHPHRARRAAQLFEKHDRRVMRQLYAMYQENHSQYIESSKESEKIIAETLKADIAGETGDDYGWSVLLSDEDAEQIVIDEKH